MISGGQSGVILFFVLSAFLLTRPFLPRADAPIETDLRQQRPSVSRFYLNRVIRILPLYYFAVLIAFLVLGNAEASFLSLLFVADNNVLKPFSPVWWSLRTEFQFYLAMGIGVVLLRSTRTRAFFLAGAALFVILHTAFSFGVFSFKDLQITTLPGRVNVLFSFANQWHVFALGGIASWLHLERGSSGRSAQGTLRFSATEEAT